MIKVRVDWQFVLMVMRYYIMKIGIYKEANSKSRNTKGEDVGRAGCQSKNKGKIRNAYN